MKFSTLHVELILYVLLLVYVGTSDGSSSEILPNDGETDGGNDGNVVSLDDADDGDAVVLGDKMEVDKKPLPSHPLEAKEEKPDYMDLDDPDLTPSSVGTSPGNTPKFEPLDMGLKGEAASRDSTPAEEDIYGGDGINGSYGTKAPLSNYYIGSPGIDAEDEQPSSRNMNENHGRVSPSDHRKENKKGHKGDRSDGLNDFYKTETFDKKTGLGTSSPSFPDSVNSDPITKNSAHNFQKHKDLHMPGSDSGNQKLSRHNTGRPHGVHGTPGHHDQGSPPAPNDLGSNKKPKERVDGAAGGKLKKGGPDRRASSPAKQRRGKLAPVTSNFHAHHLVANKKGAATKRHGVTGKKIAKDPKAAGYRSEKTSQKKPNDF